MWRRAFYADLRAETDVGSLERVLGLARERGDGAAARSGSGGRGRRSCWRREVEVMRFESKREETQRLAEARRGFLSFLIAEEVEGELRERVSSGEPTGGRWRHIFRGWRGERMWWRSREGVEALRSAVGVARSGHFPGFNFSANWYVDRTGYFGAD